MKTIWLTFLAALFIPQAAGATSWNHRDNYQIKLHFGNDYFGKKVTGVYAHAGILKIDDQCGKKGQPYWDPASVKHVKLKAKGNHFFTALVIQTGTGECQPRILRPVVQYWVYVKGGGDKAQLTKDADIPTTKLPAQAPPGGAGADWDTLNKKFLKDTKDATRTEATLRSADWAS